MSKEQEHYYASSVFAWRTAPTREEAVRGVVREAPKWAFPLNVWSCRVALPGDAAYKIRDHIPQDVPIDGEQVAEFRTARSKPDITTHS